MKYRHSFHAGNFADVHKHVALLALLAALKRKEKGFLYLETHAGRGAYSVRSSGTAPGRGSTRFDPMHEADAGIERVATTQFQAAELCHYVEVVRAFRAFRGDRHAYPGSPILAAGELRTQDRGIVIEILPPEARALELALGTDARMRVERGDGFERLRAHLPPPERRGITFIDPPYEETRADFERVIAAVAEAVRRFETGVLCAWYPIKEEREVAGWKSALSASLDREVVFSELWLYPRDSKVGLNGSGLAIINPPWELSERMQVWLPELLSCLDTAHMGGSSVEHAVAVRSGGG